jgi:DNA-binding response OmpR family regulator
MTLPLETPTSQLLQKTVLIIDADPHLQEELSVTLTSAGYRVENAFDGEAGLHRILNGREKPDVVVLDPILPKKAGFEVLREMKQYEETKGIPVIALLNLENANNIELAIRLGAASYLVKSNYSLKHIVEKIGRVLGKN